MKKALVILLALTMVMSMFAMVSVSAADELAVGQVAADYKPEGEAIKTAEDFAAMKADGKYYLANDITISETYPVDFTGTFDGNGKSITTSVPVFSEFDGVLKNLTTKGAVNIEGVKEGTYEINRGVVANIVGHYADTEITNVCNMAPITSATLGIGGVVGYVSNDEQFKVTFTKVVNYGNITASNTSSSMDCAGIAAQFDGDNGVEDYYVQFIDCANYGTINACGRPGGIMGYANASTAFINCYNAGEIQSTANYCGGIAGRLDGDSGYNYFLLENCVNDGKVIVWQSQGAGMVGYCGGFQELIYKNCTNNGVVIGHDGKNAAVTLGGIHGNNNKNAKNLVFENCVNNGEIGTTNWPANVNAGGIAGGTNGTSVLFTGCVNNADIKGNNNCGGIAGSSNGSAAATVPMYVNITKCINYGDVTGVKGYTSGILGYSYAAYDYGPSITYCVTTGDVSCQTGTATGLIGYMNCAWPGIKLEYNIIGGSLKGQTATPVADGASVNLRTLYSYTTSAGDNLYFYVPEAGTLKIENDVITYVAASDKKMTIKTPAEGGSVAKGDICKFVANDGKTYIAPAPLKGNISFDLDKATVTVGGQTVIGTVVPTDFDGASIVLNGYAFDHPVATAAIMWNNNSSFALDASKNVILEGIGDVDYFQGTSNKWGFIGNTCDAVAPRTSMADMASGNVAYELNQAIGETVFYQNINKDLFVVDQYPTVDATHAKVVMVGGVVGNQLFDMLDDDCTPATGDAIVYVVVALAVSTISLAAVAVVKKVKEN